MAARVGGDDLQVHPFDLRSAGATAATAGECTPPEEGGISPCANDVTSVGVANVVTAVVALLKQYIATANASAEQMGVHLVADAASYDDQEGASAAALGGGASPTGGAPAVPPIGAGLPAVSPPPQGAGTGEVPSTPRDIARLFHDESDTSGMTALAARLRSVGGGLDRSATTLGSAITSTAAAWASGSADAATARMRELQTWFEGCAKFVRALGHYVDDHAGTFLQTKSHIPTPKVIADQENQVRVAAQATARNPMYQPVLKQSQATVAATYQTTYTRSGMYTVAPASFDFPAGLPSPPPAPPAPRQPGPGRDSGTPPSSQPKPEPRHTPPVDEGAPAPADEPAGPTGVGAGGNPSTRGPLRPPGDSEVPVNEPFAEPFADPMGNPAAQALPSMLPSMLSGMAGGAGAPLGALGAGPKAALGGAQQALGQLGQLGQMGQMGDSAFGGEAPQLPETPGDLGDGGSGGGGGLGDTEPASDLGGALASPAGMASAPEAAAPVSAPTPVAPSAAPAGGGAMGGGMIPPMMGGAGGKGSGSEADRRLYPQRRLKMVAAPNSEPVKGRREPRRPAAEDRGGSGGKRRER